MVKVFLGALFTYQVTYFLWLKLESLENKKEGDGMSSCFFLSRECAQLTFF